MSKNFVVCQNCEIPHIENCDTCFGFGMEKSGKTGEVLTPVSSDVAHRFAPCPECGSALEIRYRFSVGLAEILVTRALSDSYKHIRRVPIFSYEDIKSAYEIFGSFDVVIAGMKYAEKHRSKNLVSACANIMLGST